MHTEVAKRKVVVLPVDVGTRGRFDRSPGLAYVISPALLLAVWQIVGMLGWIDLRFFPLPSQIAVTFVQDLVSGNWFIHVGATLGRVLFGFIAGSALGILTGALMGLVPWVRFSAYPLIASIYPIPKIAIFPLILLIFGLGEASKLVTISASCFFLLAISSMSGVMTIPRVYMDVGRNFGARGMDFIATIAIPAALPAIFSGLKLALGSAFLVVVSLEFINAESGIGWQIWRSWELFSIRTMFVSLLTVSFLGLALMVALDWLERRLVPWRL
jgi:NitT/TauT family transport system permease protein